MVEIIAEQIRDLMDNPEKIRNIAIAAHIDFSLSNYS